VYKNQFKFDKAEDMFLHALDMSERLLGKAHPHVLNRYVVGTILVQQVVDRYLADGTTLYRYNNLRDCYEKWGRVDKAAEVGKKLEALRQYVIDHPGLSFGD
jgi:tetratricopeptide (TPR) repeat protein